MRKKNSSSTGMLNHVGPRITCGGYASLKLVGSEFSREQLTPDSRSDEMGVPDIVNDYWHVLQEKHLPWYGISEGDCAQEYYLVHIEPITQWP